MINIIRKEEIELGNNQMHPFFESIKERDGFSQIDTKIHNEIYNVLKNSRDDRSNKEYIKSKIAKILKKNPHGTELKNIEELYHQYKKTLYFEGKTKKVINKLLLICEEDEFCKMLENKDSYKKTLGNIIKNHPKLFENEQNIKNLDILIQNIKTSKGRKYFEVAENDHSIGCLLEIAEKCRSKEQIEVFGYLYHTGVIIGDEQHLEDFISFIKEKNIEYFKDKLYLFDQYRKIYGNIGTYELLNICHILDGEINYKKEKMQIENAFTTASIMSYEFKKNFGKFNRDNYQDIETLLDPFYISELNTIDVGDILFVKEKIKQTLKNGEIKEKNNVSLGVMISLISLFKKYRYTDKRIEKMDIKIEKNIENYSDLIKEMFFYVYEGSKYEEKYGDQRQKEERIIIEQYNIEQLESKIPNIKEIFSYFNIEANKNDLCNDRYNRNKSNSEQISHLYYLYKHLDLQKFIKDNFKIENLEDLINTIEKIRIQQNRNNKEFIKKINMLKQFFHDKINMDYVNILLYEEYSLEYIQRLIQLKEETGYNIIKGIEKYNYASSKLGGSIKERFNDQEAYQKAKDIGFFTEFDDKSGEHTSNIYKYRNIKELMGEPEFLDFLLRNKELNLVNLAMDHYIDEDVRVDSKQVHRNYVKELYEEEKTIDFKFMNFAKKIGLIKIYNNDSSYRNNGYTKIIQNRSKIKSIFDIIFGDIEQLEESVDKTEICEIIREISWKDQLDVVEKIGNEFISKNLLLSQEEKIGFLDVARDYTKQDKIKNLQFIIKEFVDKNIGLSNKEKINFLQEIKGLKNSDLEDLQRIIEKYPEISTKELPLIIEFLTKKEELDILKKKYPNMILNELIYFNKILKEKGYNRKEILYCLDFYKNKLEEGISLLDLKGYYTHNTKEIFETLKNTKTIDDENRIEVISLYSAIEYYGDNNNKEIPAEIELSIKELFKEEKIENKDFVYDKTRDILNRILEFGKSALDNKEIAFIEIINQKGTLNLPLIENLVKFIYELNKTLDKKKTFDITKTRIRERVKKFLQKQKNRSNEDLNDFYYISKNILKSAPSIYNKVLGIIEQLEPSNIKYFYNHILPLYNTELVLQERNGKQDINILVNIYNEIKTLARNIQNSKDKKRILEEEKNHLIENIQIFFKDKFGIIKIPETISEENIESIRRHSLYLANMAGKTNEKETVLGFFLALKINDKRREFREGKEIDTKEFMAQEKCNNINDYMKKKQSLDILKDYESDNKEHFMKIMQESEISNLRGNTENIGDRLTNIDQDIDSLLEDDFYGKEEQIIKKYLIQYEDLGNSLLLKYQEKTLSEEQKKTVRQLEDDFNTKLDRSNIENIQKLMKGVSPVINFIKKIKEMELAREVEEFEKLRIPNNQLIEIFNKLGENFSDTSGMMGIIEQVRSLMTKVNEDTIILTQEEKLLAYEYLKKVNKELMDLYDIKDRAENLFITFKKTTETSNNEPLKNRLREIEHLFTKIQEGKRENIYSMLTSNFDIIIKNIRACLGCMTPECNNDTNLSFGTNNRFFITTNNKESDQSYADEIVTLLPSNEGLVFVMEQVYGKRTPDVLVNNILAVIQKAKKLNDKKIGILISQTALSSCNLSSEYLETKLKEIGIHHTIQNIEKILLKIPEQPIGDGYYEFGGGIGARGSGEVKPSGIIIYLN